jgi:hypothetical protein
MTECVIGREFGRLTVIDRAQSSRHGHPCWLCRCRCGVEKVVRQQGLMDGTSQSCGCLGRERRAEKCTTHGHARRNNWTPEFRAWRSAINRCCNPNDKNWHNYGGRGITICERWRCSFQAFFEDVGAKPSPGLQIDRIDNDGHYEPGNVRWTTPQQNTANSRRARLIEHDGKRLTMREWSRVTGIGLGTIRNRLTKEWSVADTLTKPADHRRKPN